MPFLKMMFRLTMLMLLILAYHMIGDMDARQRKAAAHNTVEQQMSNSHPVTLGREGMRIAWI